MLHLSHTQRAAVPLRRLLSSGVASGVPQYTGPVSRYGPIPTRRNAPPPKDSEIVGKLPQAPRIVVPAAALLPHPPNDTPPPVPSPATADDEARPYTLVPPPKPLADKVADLNIEDPKLEQRKLQHKSAAAHPLLLRATHRELLEDLRGEEPPPVVYLDSRGPNYGKTTQMGLLSEALPRDVLRLDFGPMHPLLRRGLYVEWLPDEEVGTVPSISRGLLYRFLATNIPGKLSAEGETVPDPASSLLHELKLPGAGASLFDDLVATLQDSTPEAACGLLAPLLDACYSGDLGCRIVAFYDGLDSSMPFPEGYVESLGSKGKRDVTWAR